MDDKSIIDRNTYKVYEHAEDYPDAFICDKRIAPVIALLNKKGYSTFASCGGHYKNEFYEWFNEDISNLESLIKDTKVIITEVRDNSFDYISWIDKTMIYILFNDKYDFEALPEGFELYEKQDDNRSCIQCFVSYYDQNNKRKKRNIVEKELNEKINKLNEWVKKLPDKKGMINYE